MPCLLVYIVFTSYYQYHIKHCFIVVFLGSDKYPVENAFDAFIKKHGGNSNAYTDCERVYLFNF